MKAFLKNKNLLFIRDFIDFACLIVYNEQSLQKKTVFI